MATLKNEGREDRAKVVLDLIKQLEGSHPITDQFADGAVEPWETPADHMPVIQPKRIAKPIREAGKFAKVQKPSYLIAGLVIVLALICTYFIAFSPADKSYHGDEVSGSSPAMETTQASLADPVQESEYNYKKYDDRSLTIPAEYPLPKKSRTIEKEAIGINAKPTGKTADKSSLPAGFLLSLDNGSQIATNDYWEADNKIWFYEDGRLVGIPRDTVYNIYKSLDYYKYGRLKIKNALAPSAVTGENTVAEEKISSDIQNKNGSKGYMEDFFTLKKRFNYAETMTDEEIYQFSEDLIIFRIEVLKSRRGSLYHDQLQAVYSMLDEVERIVVQR